MELIDERDVDWNAYLAVQDRARVRPASDWVEEVIARQQGGAATKGLRLPWGKLNDRFGVRPGEVTLWYGYNGHGKSLLLGQAIVGLLQQGAKACIASLEMKPAWTLDRMSKQVLADSAPYPDDVRAFGKWTDGRLWMYAQQDTVHWERMIALGRYVSQELGCNQLVIDSLLKCGLREEGNGALSEQKHFIDALCALATETDMHIHLVAHCRKGADDSTPPGKYDIRGSASVSDLAFNTIGIWMNRKKMEQRNDPLKPVDHNEPDGLLIVDKQRNGEWQGKLRLFFHPPSGQYADSDGPTFPMWSA